MADNSDNIFLHPRYRSRFPLPRTNEERQILDIARDSTASTYEQRWHDNFVNGRAIFGLGNGSSASGLVAALGLHHGSRDMEFRPELPAPRERPPRANPFYAHSAEDLPTAQERSPTNPNYFSDDKSERTASVAEEYQEAERAEKAAAGIDEDTSAKQQPASLKRKRSSSAPQFEPKSRVKLRIVDQMAGRGRGRGGGGMLKGVTWEYDPSIKLESKPIELFPVSIFVFAHFNF